MNICKIKIVLIGHLRHTVDINKLKRFRSRFFQISEIERIDTLPEPKKEDGYLDIAYSRAEIQSILAPVDASDLVIGIINYRFDDNFYIHRAGEDKACISIAGIDWLLLEHNISIENFILKNILELTVLKKVLGNVNGPDVYDVIHQDTRGCLFDLNGDKSDIIFNTERPMICDACKAFISSKSLPTNYIKHLEKELKRIRKPYICSIEMFIKNYPLFSVLLTTILAIMANLVANVIWEKIN